MRIRRRAATLGLGAALLALSAPSFAQGPTSGTLPAGDTAAPTPPALTSSVEAAYPAEALRDRIEGAVVLELTVDEAGRVQNPRVVTPGGHGFDEAALAAVKRFTFEPARQGGAAIASTIQFTYEFHLPTPTPTPTPIPTPTETQVGSDQSTVVLAQRPISAASSSSVRDREFQLRPIGSVQDILRVTPGLVMVQHSGGGKANQYFLRGFDADHGTDLALSIDGIPINMVSHAHGQGFSDTNFIIPEVVEKVEITKGPYFANQGDFATAGSVNMVSRNAFEHSSIGFGLSGSPGYGAPGYRGLLIASPKLENTSLKATFAAEIGRQNGPFDNPENWDKYKLFNKLTYDISPTSSITLGEMSYGGNWHGSGQVPARAVESGKISRFGSIDPDEGGNTSRHQVSVQYRVRGEKSELKALAYVGTYRFNLFSNFTLFARDADNGDEIQQVDRRTFFGGKVSYRVVEELGGVRFDTTLGADARNDDIHGQLFNTVHRTTLGTVRDNNVHETMLGAYVNEEISPAKWLRVDVGGRADAIAFAVDDNLAAGTNAGAPHGGVGGAHQLSPKLSAVASPITQDDVQLDLYANYGHGFHSNDVRGVFASPAVTPLTRAIGEEVGARTRLWKKVDFAAAGWVMDLDNETVWSGDNGTTAVSDATHRYGVELEARYEILPWLAADGDVTFTKSHFSTDGANGGGLALAPKQTWSGGLSARHDVGPGVARGGLRFYGIGDRPASDDGVIVAPGFTQFDLHAGYRLRRFDIALDIENLFNAKFRSAQFDTVSRLRTEPAIGSAVPGGFSCGSGGRLAGSPSGGGANGRFYGCEDVNYTPAYPFTARVMGTFYLD
jgi:TonB family protein